jgi:hypothetical protein
MLIVSHRFPFLHGDQTGTNRSGALLSQHTTVRQGPVGSRRPAAWLPAEQDLICSEVTVASDLRPGGVGEPSLRRTGDRGNAVTKSRVHVARNSAMTASTRRWSSAVGSKSSLSKM